jgi:hypothetical protein
MLPFSVSCGLLVLSISLFWFARKLKKEQQSRKANVEGG